MFEREFYCENAMLIRRAQGEDATALAHVLVRSIANICVIDHFGRSDLIETWIRDKTPENVSRWIEDPKVAMFVAEEGGQILACGAVRTDGTVRLNYVAPEARFRGVSKLMLAELEGFLRGLGLEEVRLESTQTARNFYLKAGYRLICETPSFFGGAPSITMSRVLSGEGGRLPLTTSGSPE